MASSQTRNTACHVELVTPEHVRLVFDSRTAQSDLLHVQTQNDMGDACGSFQLTFAPKRINGRTYDQLIPLRTLVTIRMESGKPMANPNDNVVMIGLTEDHGVTEDFSRAQPQRIVTISGRSMAAVFLDMLLRFYPGLEGKAEGVLTVGDQRFQMYIPTNFLQDDWDPRDALRAVLAYFLGVKTHLPLQSRLDHVEVQQAVQQRRAEQPGMSASQLVQDVTQQQRAPRAAAGPLLTTRLPHLSREQFLELADAMAAWDAANPGASAVERQAHLQDVTKAMPTAGTISTVPAPPPPQVQAFAAAPAGPRNVLMNLQLPGRPLADLLDANDDTWTLFDTDIRISIAMNTPYAQSLYNYLLQFVDRVFQEFFTRIEDGVCKIVFRAKPFLETTSMQGTRFSETDPTCRTLTFSQQDWEALYLGSQLRRQTANVYNTFLALPVGSQLMATTPGYEYLFKPVFHADEKHPSYVAKYGLRELRDESPYLSVKKHGDPSPTEAQLGFVERTGKEWATKAAAWYGLGSEMYAGVITVLGSPRWNIGHRLVYGDERGEREGYIEGIAHSYTYRTGQYLSQLRVTRLWYLAGLVDERGPSSGTQITQEVIVPQEPAHAR